MSGGNLKPAKGAGRRHAEDFTQMLFHLHTKDAGALAAYLDLSGHQAVLDVGGSSGVMSIALAKRNPNGGTSESWRGSVQARLTDDQWLELITSDSPLHKRSGKVHGHGSDLPEPDSYGRLITMVNGPVSSTI